MVPVTVNYLDDEVEVEEQEQSTLAEMVEILGTEGAVISEVVDNLRYRNKHPRVYTKASKELEAIVPREVKETKKNKDGTEKKILVSVIDHCRAAFKVDAKATTEAITKFALSEPLYVKGDRSGGGGRISQSAIDAANNFFADGDDKVEDVISKIEAAVPGYKVGRDGDGNPTVESLARGMQALDRFLVKQIKQQRTAMLS